MGGELAARRLWAVGVFVFPLLARKYARGSGGILANAWTCVGIGGLGYGLYIPLSLPLVNDSS